jgi:PAS domain-containing protein
LNEIFADYFISEFEDPHNAYTNAMANYAAAPAGPASAAVAAAAAAASPGQQMNAHMAPLVAPAGGTGLPTSGIRTAYHHAVAPQQQQWTQQQAGGPLSAAPVAKKPKIEYGTMPTANVAATGGITSRLGVPMPLLQQNGATPGTQAAISQLSAAAAAAALGAPGPNVAGPGGGISLPVGVGIRLGGAGGVAPSTAQNAARVGGIMWGGPQMVGMTDQAIAERRQRNREHAKRSRVRKKFMLESLQEQVSALQRENQRLRLLVQDNIPQHAQQIIADCCTSSPLFSDDAKDKPLTIEVEGVTKDATTLVRSDFQLMDSLSTGQQNFVLSDPRLPDNPIVFATPGFYRLTGYTPEQVLGRNCRFLQGPGTDPKAVDIIRKAIATGSDCTVCILNYKADGTPFWNQFFVAALRDSDNCIVNYVRILLSWFSYCWFMLSIFQRKNRRAHCQSFSFLLLFPQLQVGVQTEIEPDAGANALEDRVNAVLPLADKEDGNDDEE